MKFRIPFIIRLSIGLILITALLLSVDISQSIKQLISVNMYTVTLLSGLMVLRRAMMAYKWNLLLRAQGIWITNFHSLRLYYIGFLIGSFTPGWIGLEAYRVNALSRFHRTHSVISTIVLERFIGLIVIATFAAVGLPFSLNYIAPAVKDTRLVFWILICGVVFSWSLLMVSLYPPAVESFVQRFSYLTHISLFEKLKKFYDAYAENRKKWFSLIVFTMLTAVNAIVSVSCTYMAARSLNLDIPFGLLISTIPLLLILLRLPVTISGIGVQEGLYAFLFSIAGFSSADGVTVSLLLRLIALLIGHLPASILFLFK